MVKKAISLILILLMALGLFTACGPTSYEEFKRSVEEEARANNGAYTVTGKEITLTYWYYEDSTTVEYLAKKFTEEYPNITVECHQIGSDVAAELAEASENNTMPDAFVCTDADTALSNMYWRNISEYVEADPEYDNLLDSLKKYGVGKFDTKKQLAVPMWYQPSTIYVDKKVVEKLGLEMPDLDWTWDEMIDLIKAATVHYDDGQMDYYGLGYYRRLDGLYGIAASMKDEDTEVKGEFGYNGTTFDLSYWEVGEQEFSDLQQEGYVAPATGTDADGQWTGDANTWCGLTEHVAVFSEGFWTYMNIWNTEDIKKNYDIDVVPYAIPSVGDSNTNYVVGDIYLGGVYRYCKHPYEAYLLLKWMGWGKDGWDARLSLYENDSIKNESGVPLKNANMPAPLTKDPQVWARYRQLFPTDNEHAKYWDAYFDSVMNPVPYGWYAIAGYWTFCDQYFNAIDIHGQCDAGTARAAQFTKNATAAANFYHAQKMLEYFGHDGYNCLEWSDTLNFMDICEKYNYAVDIEN